MRLGSQRTRIREVITMDVNGFMAKHGLTDAELDRMAAAYEDASFGPEPHSKVRSGSHIDAVGKHLPNDESLASIKEAENIVAKGGKGYTCAREMFAGMED